MSLIEFQRKFDKEIDCIKFLEEARWGGEPVCPHCGCLGAYKFKSGKILKCKACRKQFTVRIGTIFEDSRLPLSKWFLAIYLLTSMKKGLSSIQMGKYLKVTQKTAWFVLQRIRYAVNTDQFKNPLSNIVETDETYIGGKGKNKRGRGAENKTPVFGMVERQGDVRAKAVENVKMKTIMPLIQKNIAPGSNIMTDEYNIYNQVKQSYNHQFVKHIAKEYARGDVHTNTIEGFWSHLKRGISAIYVQVSKKHLQKYCDEFSFRYNSRKMQDFERFTDWFTVCDKRLTYKTLIRHD